MSPNGNKLQVVERIMSESLDTLQRLQRIKASLGIEVHEASALMQKVEGAWRNGETAEAMEAKRGELSDWLRGIMEECRAQGKYGYALKAASQYAKLHGLEGPKNVNVTQQNFLTSMDFRKRLEEDPNIIDIANQVLDDDT